jgi:uncharacterized protein
MADAPSGGVDLQFAWDDEKAASNLEKHGVSFEEAATVFRDPFALIFDDEAHSIEEQREIMIGHSTCKPAPASFFTERGDKLRIFSARPATRGERQDYERHTNL